MFIDCVFEGGGIKGLSYVGALRYLDERGYKIFRACGTSVGALFAGLIVAGYNSYEIEEIINNFDANILTQKQRLTESIKNKGLYSLSSLEEHLEYLMKQKNKTTFLDVKFGEDYLLKMVACNIKERKIFIIPDDLKKINYDPDKFKISKAIAISCAIPLFFNRYKLGGYSFVDGGAVNNFPIYLFSSSKNPIVAFRLNKDNNRLIKTIQKSYFKFDNNVIIPKVNIINLGESYIKTTQFKKGISEKKRLYLQGFQKTKEYFENIYFKGVD